MNKTQTLSCRVTAATLKEINAAAEAEQITRAEWLDNAIARQLGKRPRVPLAARVAKLERIVQAYDID